MLNKASFPSGSLARRLFTLAWPSVIEQVQRTLLGLLDVYIVGQLGAIALTAAGLGGQVQQLALVVHSVFSLGAVILVARAIGAGARAGANLFAGQALMSALVYSLAASVLVILWAEPMLASLGATGRVLESGTRWLHYVGVSFPFAGMMVVGSAALRGAGDTRTPLAVAFVAGLVQLILAWTLTRGVLGAPRLDLAGHGLAVLASCVTGSGLMLMVLRRGGLAWPWTAWRPCKDRLAQVWRVGAPSGVEQLLVQVAFTTSAAMLAQLGTAAYAANQITNWLAALAYLPGWGIAVAVVTLVGQEFGARRPLEVQRAVRLGLITAVLMNSSLGFGLAVAGGWLLPLFSTDVEVIVTGMPTLWVVALFQPAMAAAFIYTSALTGAGETRSVMVISVVSTWLVRLGVAYLAGFVLGWGLTGFWLAIGADYVCRALLARTWYRRGRWRSAWLT